MRLIHLGLANVNSTVGAVQSNVDKAIHLAQLLAEKDVHVAAFPEQMVGGYSAEDLVQWQSFLKAQLSGLHHFANQTAELKTMFAIGLLLSVRGQIYNCAALVFRGRIWGICPKERLPLYNVFYEGRTLSQGIPGHVEELELWVDKKHRLMGPINGSIPFGDMIFQCGFGTLAIEVCEDLWSPAGPMRRRCLSGAELVINLSASPFRLGISKTRNELINTRSFDNQATLMYVNAVGANDGLVFDGGGYVAQNGRTVFTGTRFREGFEIACVDLDRTSRLRAEDTTFRLDYEDFYRHKVRTRIVEIPHLYSEKLSTKYPIPTNRSFFLPIFSSDPSNQDQFCEEILSALALGLGDYFEKTKAFQCIGVALSGGRDSLLCLLLAHLYLRNKYAHLSDEARRSKIRSLLFAFYMPSQYSSLSSEQAAKRIAQTLDILLTIVPIDEAVAIETKAASDMLNGDKTLDPITLQNIQARIRGERMWNWANSAKGLFLQTSNMSEKAVGYTTIGGDMMGCLSPIANLPKTVVNYLLEYLSTQPDLSFIQDVLSHPASAELANGQESEHDLMPFSVLDSCIALFIGEKMHPVEVKQILAQMFTEYSEEHLNAWVEKFTKLFTQSIYKWVQTPLAIHVGHLDLDRERALQIPVVTSTEWLQIKK